MKKYKFTYRPRKKKQYKLQRVLKNTVPLIDIIRMYSLFQAMQAETLFILYRVSQEECARLRESVPYVKVY